MSLQAFYLPFALAALSFFMGGDWVSDVLGIVVGHLCVISCPKITPRLPCMSHSNQALVLPGSWAGVAGYMAHSAHAVRWAFMAFR